MLTEKAYMIRTEPWCPNCVSAMTSRLHEARPIWWCAQCLGTFLPAEQLREIAVDERLPRSREERLKEMAAAAAGPAGSELLAPPVDCPWCAQPMQRAAWDDRSAILVDRCDAGCGLWLDGGELERVEAWSEANRAGVIPPPTAIG